MKKTLLISLLFITLFIWVKAEDQLKIQTSQNGDVYTFGLFAGQLTFNNGDVIGDPNSYNEGYFLARFDSSGQTKWVKHIKTSTLICYGRCQGYGLSLDKNDNVYVTANFRDSIFFTPTHVIAPIHRMQAFVAKYDSSGTFVWARTAVGSDESRGIDVGTDAKGNVYATGIFDGGTLAFDTLPPLIARSYTYDIYIVKFDSTGTQRWIKQIHGGGTGRGSTHYVMSLFTNPNGDSYITGMYGGTFRGNLRFELLTLPSSGDFQTFLAKFNRSGHPQWMEKVDRLTGNNGPEEIVADQQNSVFLTGQFSIGAKFGTLPSIFSMSNDIYVARYDPQGNAIWAEACSPHIATSSNQTRGIAVDPWGHSFTIGIFGDEVAFPPLPIVSADSGYGFMVKHDSVGNALCVSNHNLSFEDITIDPSGNAYAISREQGIAFTHPITISKWDNNCNHRWNIEIGHFIDVSNEALAPQLAIDVFPNPTSDIITIKTNTQLNKPVTLELFDMQGSLLLTTQFTRGQQQGQVDLSSFSQGVFLLKIKTEKGFLTKRIIKQ